MTPTETKLVEAGAALARSLGHSTGCPKASSAVPCVCGHGKDQAKALGDWYAAVKELSESS